MFHLKRLSEKSAPGEQRGVGDVGTKRARSISSRYATNERQSSRPQDPKTLCPLRVAVLPVLYGVDESVMYDLHTLPPHLHASVPEFPATRLAGTM